MSYTGHEIPATVPSTPNGSDKNSLSGGNDAANRLRALEIMLSGIRDFAYALDRNGRFIYVNKALLDLWGIPLEQAVGKNFFDLKYPDDLAAKLQRQIQQVIETRQVLVDETPYTSPSGQGGYYEYILSPVLSPNGEVVAVAGSTRDYTERKRTEQALLQASAEALAAAEANAKFRAFFDQGTYFAGVMTLDGTLIEANRLSLDACGFTRDEIIGKKFWDCGWWNRSPALMEMIRDGTAQAAGGTFFRKETTYFISDGTERHVDLTLAPVMDSTGRVLFIAPTGIDITDRKQLTDEREHLLEAERSARAEAERTSRIKDEFLATLSHELRTPLSAILGWTQILTSGTKDPADLAEGLKTIERNARAQTQIIDDLLDMSRIISGKVRLDIQRIDLASIVQAAVETTLHAANAKGVRIHTVLDPRAGLVSGDPNRLQQIFWNLLTNAIKFTPKDGSVQVRLERVNSHLEVSVTDTGEGIAPEFIPHVFDRFRQADASTTRRHGGLGLGLSIVKQLVELHGGSIHVRSNGIGQGATFIIDLPMTVLHGDAEPHTQRRHSRSSPLLIGLPQVWAKIEGVRVLIVDDEPDARALIKRLLEDAGASVTTAAESSQATQLIQSGNFDVLISDIGMPREDGYALIRRVRSLDPSIGGNIPAIALTAYGRAEDRIKAVSAGFHMHITKPVEPAELITLVAAAAGRTKQPEKSSL
jgi:PAS domain S-box-containing protein